MSGRIFGIDIASCTGCQTCQVACADRSSYDEAGFLTVTREQGGTYPLPQLAYRVSHCFHCENPSCMAVCPAEAIVRDNLGLVQILAEECVGCGACAVACPFGAITMLSSHVAAKCDGCADELALGWEPTCVRACPMRALSYGADEPEKRVLDSTFDEHDLGPAVAYWVRPQGKTGEAS